MEEEDPPNLTPEEMEVLRRELLEYVLDCENIGQTPAPRESATGDENSDWSGVQNLKEPEQCGRDTDNMPSNHESQIPSEFASHVPVVQSTLPHRIMEEDPSPPTTPAPHQYVEPQPSSSQRLTSLSQGRAGSERKEVLAAQRDEETQAAKAKLRQYEAMGHIKVEMDEMPIYKDMELQNSEDPEDAQPDDSPTTMVIPFPAATLSQEGGCYGPPVALSSGQTQLIMSQSLAVQPRVGGMVDVPTLTDLEGKYGFAVSVDDKERSTKSPMWLMSTIVNKLYTNLNKAVPFEVRLKSTPSDDEKLFIRAILVFSSPEFLRTNVTRCPNHAATSEATNHDFPYPNHVVRADHPAALYQESASGRLSVVVPLDLQQNGPDYALILLRFMCLGSCVGGISRRPISIVLTLENGQAEVLGRKVIDVRVCACPTRDIRTDEHAASNRGVKRKGSSTQAQQVIKKKPKMVEPKLDLDEGSQEVFNIKVHGRQLYTFMLNMMRVYYSTHPDYALRYPDPTITMTSSIRQKNTANVKEKISRTDIVEENNSTAGKSAGNSPVHDGNLVIDSQESPPHTSPANQLQQLPGSIPSTMSVMVMNRETNGMDPVNVLQSNIKSATQALNVTSIPVFSSSTLSTPKVVPRFSSLTSARPQLITTHSDNITSNGSSSRHVPVRQVLREPPLRRVNSDLKTGGVRQPLAFLKSSPMNNVTSVSTTSVALGVDIAGQEEENSSHDSEEILAANVLAAGFAKKSRK